MPPILAHPPDLSPDEVERIVGFLGYDTGLTREGLYKAFSPEGNPSFGTVLKVAKTMGLTLTLKAAA